MTKTSKPLLDDQNVKTTARWLKSPSHCLMTKLSKPLLDEWEQSQVHPVKCGMTSSPDPAIKPRTQIWQSWLSPSFKPVLSILLEAEWELVWSLYNTSDELSSLLKFLPELLTIVAGTSLGSALLKRMHSPEKPKVPKSWKMPNKSGGKQVWKCWKEMAERTRGNKAAGKKRKEARKKPKRSRKEAKKKPKSEKGDCTVGWFQYTAAVRAEVSGSPSEAVGWQDGTAGSHHEAPDHWGPPKLLQSWENELKQRPI